MKEFGRLLTAMVTPFDNNLQVDYEAVKILANYLIENDNDGIVVSGTTGESPNLTKEEKLKLFKTVKDAVGNKATVIAGTGSYNTSESIELTKAAEEAGVDGVMLVVPYYNKPSQAGLYEHFKTIAECTSLPVMLYNVPGRTSSNLLPETVAELAKIENIVAIKEASGSMEQVTTLKQMLPEDFRIYSGDDALTLPILAIGGYGIVSVAGHVVSKEIKAMINSFLEGDISSAYKANVYLFDFFKKMFITSNPVPVKTALNMTGIKVGGLRLPLIGPNDEQKEIITETLKKYKKI